jgi:hypothetical protein
MINELEGIWKETAMAQLGYCPDIFWRDSGKTTKVLGHCSLAETPAEHFPDLCGYIIQTTNGNVTKQNLLDTK